MLDQPVHIQEITGKAFLASCSQTRWNGETEAMVSRTQAAISPTHTPAPSQVNIHKPHANMSCLMKGFGCLGSRRRSKMPLP